MSITLFLLGKTITAWSHNDNKQTILLVQYSLFQENLGLRTLAFASYKGKRHSKLTAGKHEVNELQHILAHFPSSISLKNT
jgi:hypothetical protein